MKVLKSWLKKSLKKWNSIIYYDIIIYAIIHIMHKKTLLSDIWYLKKFLDIVHPEEFPNSSKNKYK